MALIDYPEIHEAFKKHFAEKEAIVEQVAPLRADYEAVQAEIDVLRDKQRAIGDKMKEFNPALVEIDTKLSAMARATGGQSLNS